MLVLLSTLDWDGETSCISRGDWNEQALGMPSHFSLILSFPNTVIWILESLLTSETFYLPMKLNLWTSQKEGTYKGKKFNAICHFFGYQARGSLPSKFDCDYAYVSHHHSHREYQWNLTIWMDNDTIKWKILAGTWTYMLPHPWSWSEWLHGNCNQPKKSCKQMEMWCCTYHSWVLSSSLLKKIAFIQLLYLIWTFLGDDDGEALVSKCCFYFNFNW